MRIRPSLMAISAIFCLASVDVGAQTFEPITTNAGKPIRVASFWNCRTNTYPGASGSASFGTIEVRRTTQNRCSNSTQPVEELWYTPNKGFKGEDSFQGYSGSGRVDRRITVK